jgi:DNA-directed RNA polymerase specialized sigma24 family protein
VQQGEEMTLDNQGGAPASAGTRVEGLVARHQPTLESLASFPGVSADDVMRIIVAGWWRGLEAGTAFDINIRTVVFREVIVQIAELENRIRGPGSNDPKEEPAVEPTRFEGRTSPFADYFLTLPPSFAALVEGGPTEEARTVAKGTLATLPFAERVVVALRDVGKWSPEEVVELLEIDPIRQRVLLHAGRARVRRALEQLIDRRKEGDG